MSKHDESRRAFFVGAAVGAVAGTRLVGDTRAQTHEQHGAADAAATTTQAHSPQARTARSSMTSLPLRLRNSPSG